MNVDKKSTRALRLMNHIKEVKKYPTTDKELTKYIKRAVIKAMTTGKLSLVFPPDVVEDMLAFAKEQLANGRDTVLIGLRTKKNGVVIFEYYVESNERGVDLNLNAYYVPDSSSQVSLPQDASGRCLVIDIDSD